MNNEIEREFVSNTCSLLYTMLLQFYVLCCCFLDRLHNLNQNLLRVFEWRCDSAIAVNENSIPHDHIFDQNSTATESTFNITHYYCTCI